MSPAGQPPEDAARTGRPDPVGGSARPEGRRDPPGGAEEGPAASRDGVSEPPDEVPLHPALLPRGEAIAWSAMGSLLAGPVVWGGVGAIADQVLGTGRIFLAIGIVLGAVTGMWIVYVRFGHDDGENRS